MMSSVEDVPIWLAFLDEIDSTIIGFAFPVIWLVLFYLFLRKRGRFLEFIPIIGGIYVASIGIGIFADGAVSDRMSAIVAGIYAPILICFLTSIYIIRNWAVIDEPDELSDHLIDSNENY